jgi:sn-glycerol 3-phosphate transport system permease protein
MSEEQVILGNKTLVSTQHVSATKQKTKSVLKNKLAHQMLPYGLVAPSMIIFCVFMIYPIVYMTYLSFHKWNMLSDKKFIGFENYSSLLGSAEFMQVMMTTLKFMVGTVLGSIILALIFALYLKENRWINRFLQGVIFAPYIVSLVSIAFIFMWMMDGDYGLFNYILGFFGIDGIRWLEDPNVAIYSLVIVNIWKGVGYYTLIFIAALQGIPKHLYEAAKLDRANKIRTFFKITLPMISPTLFFVTLTGVIGGLKVFETINIMTGGSNNTNTLVYSIYEYGFSFYKIGYASAIGMILMVLISIMTFFYFHSLSKRVHYQ